MRVFTIQYTTTTTTTNNNNNNNNNKCWLCSLTNN